jgi:hypothetical protein
LAGKLEVVNLWLPPKPELVGTRIVIVATEVDSWDLWMLPSLHKVKLATPKNHVWSHGVLGTCLLAGWVRTELGKGVVGQYRPGNTTQFRKLKGLTGPVGWVLRQPETTRVPNLEGLLRIRAGYWDQAEVQKYLVWYAETYGTKDLSPEYLARLEVFRPKWKGKLEGYDGNAKPAGSAGSNPG